MPIYRSGEHGKPELWIHLVCFPKYRNAVLVGLAVLRVRDLLREIAMEQELTILSAKVARNHGHL